MKKTNYFLALALAAAPVTLVNAAEEQDAQSQWELTEVAVQQGAQEVHPGNAEFVVTGEDFKVQTSGNNKNNIQIKQPAVVYKPHQGDKEKGYTNQDFAKLWNSNNQYAQANPSATLAWKNGQDRYEMIATISSAKGGKRDLTLTAVTGDPQLSFQKNDQTITQNEFLEATSKNGKQEIAVWINETGQRPHDGTTSHDTGTNPDQGKNPSGQNN